MATALVGDLVLFDEGLAGVEGDCVKVEVEGVAEGKGEGLGGVVLGGGPNGHAALC